ncbi:Rqc2 family fibronectin-binding protein [Paenibacillus gansuensis]|uniref:Rqc2 homolog RqcH n=1 Tax=Paenibacillus gansuensis TaxID=306542 RepID=A0ABW5PG17_9BACL
MALDGLVVRAVVHELQMCVGSRINKIHQPNPHDIILQIRAQGANRKLLLSANPTYPRVHFTTGSYTNPMDAPMFCMLLRKHCESGIIEAVEQVDNERIIRIQVRQRDELGDLSVKTLVIELMGRHSNLILLDPGTGQILDGIHHVTPAISSYRIVMPGSTYVGPPEQGKLNPLTAGEAEVKGILAQEGFDLKPEQGIVQHFSGLSPLAAREIVFRSGTHTAEGLAEAFLQTMEDMRAHNYVYNIVENEATGKAVFSVLELRHAEGSAVLFESLSECLEAYYGDKAERDTVKQRVSDLIRFLQNEKSKNEKKLEKLHETVEEAKDADKFRITGELLTASLHLLKRGDKDIEVVNYYDEDQALIKIQLDPQLTPSENAQRYFKKYNKSKNSLMIVGEQIENTHKENVYIDSLLQQLSNASLSDIDEIREELTEQGYIRDRAKKGKKKKKSDKPQLLCYTSSEGIPIYVGKNNTQNEYLTNRLASPSDTWLHTKDIPGSHVVIKSPSFGDPTLEEAGMLAAYYSQARESSQVPVDYTLIRHVRKPNGAKPGFVIFDHNKTLYITADEDRIKKLPFVVK